VLVIDPTVFWYLGGFFLALALAGVGIGIPEEVIVASAGVWVGTNPDLGPLRWLSLPVCILGIVLSDVMLYGIGRWWGNRLLQHPWFARILKPEKREQIEKNLHVYGLRILVFVRWVPGIRSPMFITAGTMRLPLLKFVIADAIAATIGHTMLFFLAWWLGDIVKDLIEEAERTAGKVVHFALLLVVIAIAGAYFLFHFYKRPVTTANPADVPLIGGKVAAKLEPHEQKPVEAPLDNHAPESVEAVTRQSAP
jgi:membrane protein DedA with SNARE-associated domain